MVVPVSLVRASVDHLPFPGAVFDTIVMTWTLRSIPNPIAAFTEMRRVLRPERAIDFRRARLVARDPNCSLAASVDAVLETN
jgi:ubiquinone/menaquinone biosynthesis C-methylase UbiE